MCSFPASGSSWKSFAREGVAMDEPGCRQGVTLLERSELVPKEPTPAIPPRQPFLPNPRDLMGVPSYSSKVARYAVVGIVAPHHRGQMGALVRDRLMPVDPTPSRNRRQRSGVTGLCRSGRIVARTGLRMMPTFPRSPLTFRKASFPRYG